MLATTTSPCSRAMFMSVRWPRWRLPIVGTNATRCPSAMSAESSPAVLTISMRTPRSVTASACAQVEELALAAHRRDASEQQIEMSGIVHEVEALAVDDQQGRLFIAVE